MSIKKNEENVSIIHSKPIILGKGIGNFFEINEN